ncbi:MAG: uroporphyrinogen-III decarboxylase-like protein [Bacteroidetes bacterium]|nr:uroporphyrinogen-III decarboxylase-like protein [Bacteroidota bacterium]
MKQETMTPKERWKAVLNRKQPDRIPVDWWGTVEVEKKVKAHLGLDDIWDVYKKLHIDKLIKIEPEYVGPKLAQGTDWFGCKFKGIPYGKGEYEECVFHPLAQYETIEEIEAHYTWPDPDWFDYSGMTEKLVGKEEYPAQGPHSEPFYFYKYLRGDEQAFMDLILNPELTEYILEKIFSYEHTRIQRTLEAVPGKLTCGMVAEDLGAQSSLMYSLAHIEKFFFPRMKKMMNLLHQDNIFVMTHSDGAVRDAIPGLINCGMDVLNPVQWRCTGMEREGLKRDFGNQIIFYGGVDNQITLPFGSVADVRKEVIDNINILGDGGGYILAPCHNLQSVSPVENIITLFETAYHEGWN